MSEDNEDDWFDNWAFNLQADMMTLDELDVDAINEGEEVKTTLSDMASCINHQGEALIELGQRIIVLTSEIRTLDRAFMRVSKLGESLGVMNGEQKEAEAEEEEGKNKNQMSMFL